MHWEIVAAVIGSSTFTAVVSWLLTGRQRAAAVAHTEADTAHTFAETTEMSHDLYRKLFSEHRDLMSRYNQLSLRLIRIEKWACENGYALPNGDHSA